MMHHREVSITLNCCGKHHNFIVNERAIISGDLDEVRKNIICSQCDRLVILELSFKNGQCAAEQEILEM